MFTKINSFVERLQEEKIEVSTTASGNVLIAPKQRNPLGKELNQLLFELFSAADLLTYKTSDGVVIAVPNDSLADNDNVTGDICFAIKVTVKGLDYDAETEAEIYAEERQAAEDRKKETALKKQAAYENALKARALKNAEKNK